MDPDARVLCRFTWDIRESPDTAQSLHGVLDQPLGYTRFRPCLPVDHVNITRKTSVRDVLRAMHRFYTTPVGPFHGYPILAFVESSERRLELAHAIENQTLTWGVVASIPEMRGIAHKDQCGVGPIMTGLVRVNDCVRPCFVEQPVEEQLADEQADANDQ